MTGCLLAAGSAVGFLQQTISQARRGSLTSSSKLNDAHGNNLFRLGIAIHPEDLGHVV